VLSSVLSPTAGYHILGTVKCNTVDNIQYSTVQRYEGSTKIRYEYKKGLVVLLKKNISLALEMESSITRVRGSCSRHAVSAEEGEEVKKGVVLRVLCVILHLPGTLVPSAARSEKNGQNLDW
jgi:hypothetical protein